MLICFYPGAGGNRFYLYLLNKFYKKHGVSFDRKNNFQGNNFIYRYLESDEIYKFDDVVPVLTHCLNYKKLKLHFPFKTKFVIIKSDLQSSLRRQWLLEGVSLYQNELEKKMSVIKFDEFFKINSAFETIKFHSNYYNNYTNDLFSMENENITKVIIQSQSNNEFERFMHSEIDLYQSKVFDFAWDMYKQYGDNTPIIDLYKKTFL